MSFSMLKAVLVSLHGVRGKKEKYPPSRNISDVEFGLIPTEENYECR